MVAWRRGRVYGGGRREAVGTGDKEGGGNEERRRWGGGLGGPRGSVQYFAGLVEPGRVVKLDLSFATRPG
jgi:hypothetical protein